MNTETDIQFRKISRDFKAKVEFMKKTPLEDFEKMISEYYDEGIATYLRIEKEKHPDMTEKEILVERYKLREKLKWKRHLK
jgi:hypothetical protein